MTAPSINVCRAGAAILLACTVPSTVALAQDGPVRPGDRIALRIVRDSVIGDTLLVDERGSVVMPFVGDVPIAGVAGAAVQDSIRATLSRYAAPTSIEAVLLRRVRVVGEVYRPGVFFMDRTATLVDALARAGGPTIAGEATKILLDRHGTHQEIANWHTDPAGQGLVDSGDQLFVPRMSWVRLNAPPLLTAAATILATVLVIVTR